MIRRRFRFYGTVQGVGLRYTVRQAARAMGLTGFVRNEYDGSVTAEVQGDAPAIDRMREMVENAPYIRIDRWECTGLPVDPQERAFRVLFW